jgi:hypothetical protein
MCFAFRSEVFYVSYLDRSTYYFTVEYAVLAMSHDMLSPNRIANCLAGAKLFSVRFPRRESIYMRQNTKHKGALNHNITMTKSGKLVEPNGTGAIGVLGIAGFYKLTGVHVLLLMYLFVGIIDM